MRDVPRIAVVGAGGLVGREVLAVLGERRVPVASLRAYATDRSAGEEVARGDDAVRIERLPPLLSDVDVVFLCASAAVSEDVTEDLVDEGVLVIDLTGIFGENGDVPLLAPGITVEPAAGGRVVSIADPRSVVLSVLVRALEAHVGVRRAHATFMVPASFSGRDSVERLVRESIALLGGQEAEDPDGFAFNCRPQEALDERVRRQVARLVGRDLPVGVRTLRYPAFHGLGASVWIEVERALEAADLEVWLRASPSLLVGERPEGTRGVVGSDAIHVESIRTTGPWLSLWASADNLRQGAALSAVAALEALFSPER